MRAWLDQQWANSPLVVRGSFALLGQLVDELHYDFVVRLLLPIRVRRVELEFDADDVVRNADRYVYAGIIQKEHVRRSLYNYRRRRTNVDVHMDLGFRHRRPQPAQEHYEQKQAAFFSHGLRRAMHWRLSE